MSIIHDALKKAQEQRKENKKDVPFKNKTALKKKPNLILIGGVAAFALAIIAYLYIPAFHKPKLIPVNKPETAKAVPKPAESKPAEPGPKIVPEKNTVMAEVKEKPVQEKMTPVAREITVNERPVPGIAPERKWAPGKPGPISRDRRQPGPDVEPVYRTVQRSSEDDFINTQYNEALKLMSAGQLREAQKVFLTILARKPDHIESLNNMGVVSASLGHKKEAKAYFKKLLEYRSNYPKAYNNLGLLMMSDDPQLAEEYFRKAIALEPDTLEPYLNLSALLTSQKRFAESAKVLEMPIGKDTSDAQLFLSYAVIKDHLGQSDDAIRYYRLYLATVKQARGKDRIAERLRYLEERRMR